MRAIHLIWTGLFLAVEILVVIRAILRPNREPAARLAWVAVILALPVVGVIAYLLLGEARVSLARRRRGRSVESTLPRPAGDIEASRRLARGLHDAPFALARTINGLEPTSGNRARLAADSNAAVREMIADIDAATDSVHACFYIWLDDRNGLALKDSMIRAARRGTQVRVLADALGSHRFVRSDHWRQMKRAGVDAIEALPVGNLAWTMIRGRVDLRNHRKSLVVDNRLAWIGSQNAADPEFRIKPAFAPWVDIMSRWEGPVARQCQYVFVSDWMSEGGDDLSHLLDHHGDPGNGTIVAQVIGTGPTGRFDAMPTLFTELIHSARRELVITTPYFVPDEQLLFAIISAARRGVRTVLVIPRRIDSRIVAATCKSYYGDLVGGGVELYEYRDGLLHSKTMTVDGSIGLIGSANLDRRSFELNFENNILFADETFTRELRMRQEDYRTLSDRIGTDRIEGFSAAQRLWQNFMAMLSPLL